MTCPWPRPRRPGGGPGPDVIMVPTTRYPAGIPLLAAGRLVRTRFLARLPKRELEHLLGRRGERDVARWRLLSPADDLDDVLAHRVLADLQLLQRPRRHAFGFPHQPEQEMLGTDVVVVELSGLLLRVDD